MSFPVTTFLQLGQPGWITPFLAHSMAGQAGAFYDGTLHAFTTMELLMPLLGLGLLAGQHGASHFRGLLFGFAAGSVAATGVTLLSAPLSLTVLTLAIWATLLLLGVFVAAHVQLGIHLLSLCAACIALMGTQYALVERGHSAEAELFLLGFLLSAFFFLLVVSALVVRLMRGNGWRSIGIRAAGSWLAAIALILLAARFKPQPLSSSSVSAVPHQSQSRNSIR